jgi:hypothetical protein
MAELGARLTGDGYPVYWAPGIGADPTETVWENADRLAEFIGHVSRRHDRRPVMIVGHSFGGIVARAYLETDRYAEAREAGVRVSQLVTLGAPMGGVDLWLPLLFILGNPFIEPSVWELTPAGMAAFNASHRPPPDVRYVAIAGDARSQTPLLRWLPASDGAITVASAQALDGPRGQLIEPRTDDIHTVNDLTRLLGLHSYLDHTPTYHMLIAPALAGTALRGLGPSSERPPAAGSVVHGPSGWIHLGPGERRHVRLNADQAAGLILGADAGVAVAAVAAPGPGTTVDPWPVGTDGRPAGPSAGGASGEPAGPTIGPLAGSLLPLGASGATLALSNAGAGPATVAWVPLYPPGTPGLAVSARGDAGRLVVVLAAGVAGPMVPEVELAGPGGTTRLAVADDGIAPDERAGDGRFTGQATVPPGYHLVRARGGVDGRQVEAEAVAIVPPAIPPARILTAHGDVSAGGVGARLGVQLDVDRPGPYLVQVSLRRGGPEVPAAARAGGARPVWLGQGRHELAVRLTATAVDPAAGHHPDGMPADSAVDVAVYSAAAGLVPLAHRTFQAAPPDRSGR